MMPPLINGIEPANARATAHRMLEEVRFGERINHRPKQLSGGENQRVAIARANNPDIVIGDEPTGNLDSRTSEKIYELLRRLNRKHNQTFILVTHDEQINWNILSIAFQHYRITIICASTINAKVKSNG